VSETDYAERYGAFLAHFQFRNNFFTFAAVSGSMCSHIFSEVNSKKENNSMALRITDECITCGACEPECPNTAIYEPGMNWRLFGQEHAAMSPDYYYIVADKCTECVGFHEESQCSAVCPVDACVKDPNFPETKEALLAKKVKLEADKR
jgi:ferredoxin